MITKAIVEDPINPRLQLAMCKLLKHERRYQEALQLINAAPEKIRQDKEITQLQSLLSFYIDAGEVGDIKALVARTESSPEDMKAKKQLAAYYVIHQRYDEALQQLDKIMKLDQKYADNYAQKAMLRVFTLLGEGHPLVADYRPSLKRYVH